MPELRDPKDVEIECPDGTMRVYTISKLPAIAGREIVTQYLTTATPKIGEYRENEALMKKLMSYVEAQAPNGVKIRLSTGALIDNHVPDWETLMRLEKEMAVYNVSFFRNGKLSIFMEDSIQTAISRLAPMLTDLLRQSSEKSSQPTGN
ncbi:MAG: hypothetical protein LBJ76_04075 [Candidatus Accumulibacter sp.]|jgi:hypothetical protein|nr:hypothetical protein [Accumulibacter sp.]